MNLELKINQLYVDKESGDVLIIYGLGDTLVLCQLTTLLANNRS